VPPPFGRLARSRTGWKISSVISVIVRVGFTPGQSAGRRPAQREEKLRDISHRVTATLRIELERHLSRDVDAARSDRLERRAQLLDSLIRDVVFITQRRSSHPVRRRHGPNRKGTHPYRRQPPGSRSESASAVFVCSRSPLGRRVSGNARSYAVNPPKRTLRASPQGESTVPGEAKPKSPKGLMRPRLKPTHAQGPS
jgi:hypothetical protein